MRRLSGWLTGLGVALLLLNGCGKKANEQVTEGDLIGQWVLEGHKLSTGERLPGILERQLTHFLSTGAQEFTRSHRVRMAQSLNDLPDAPELYTWNLEGGYLLMTIPFTNALQSRYEVYLEQGKLVMVITAESLVDAATSELGYLQESPFEITNRTRQGDDREERVEILKLQWLYFKTNKGFKSTATYRRVGG